MKRFWESAGPRRIDILLALLCGIALVAIQHVSFAQRAEWLVFDKFTQWTGAHRPLHPDLAIVAIDDSSLDDYGAKLKQWAWPWPRGAYADMIAYLKASGAREIWIDLIFTSPDPDGYQDDLLRSVAQAAGNVHFAQGQDSPTRFQPTFNVHLPETTEKNPVIHSDITQQHLLAWPEPFNQLKAFERGIVTPAAHLVNDGDFLLRRLPADDRLDPAKVRTFLEQAPPPAMADRFRDKIVYIGITAQSGYDLKSFPVGASEPSVMIHVVARSNELQNGFFREIPDWLRDLFILLAALLAADLFRRVPSFHRYAACLAALAVIVSVTAFALFMERIWIRPVLIESSLLLTFVVVTSVNYVREGRKRRLTEDLFGKFVSRKMVDRLIARPEQVKLGGEKAELTVMFSDLSGFTTLSESMSSDVLLSALNAYLNEMSELIYEQEGTLDKYIGDAIMAFWGAPDVSPDHAWRACYAALACQKRLAELAPLWEQEYGARLSARIGINTDEMTVGLVGSNRLHNYSVIGDAVNLASRMEGANKPFGTSIMISQRTVDLAQGRIEVRPLAKLQVKGKSKAVTVYELLARAGELTEDGKDIQMTFTEAFHAFLARDWAKAESLLNKVLSLNAKDPLAIIYLERTRLYAQSPPDADWEGVFKLDEK